MQVRKSDLEEELKTALETNQVCELEFLKKIMFGRKSALKSALVMFMCSVFVPGLIKNKIILSKFLRN